MSEFVLTPAERALIEALDSLGIRYLIVGMGAAIIEGADGTTQDLDLWLGRFDGTKLAEAAHRAGGFYTAGFGALSPSILGEGLSRIDLVLTAHGLDSFEAEYARAHTYELDQLEVRVLPIERVLASKRAAARPKDQIQIPGIEAAIAARDAGREPTPGKP